MSIDVITDQNPAETALVSTAVPRSTGGKLLYGVFIVLMPILAFWATDLFKPEWQTGEFADYLILFLFPQASLLFFVLLAYSIVCYWLLLIDFLRHSQNHVVRFGVYTGVLLALQYSILAGLYIIYDSNTPWSIPYLIVLWALPLVLPKIYAWLVRRWTAKTVKTVLLLLVLFVFVVGSLLTRSLLFPFVLIMVGVTTAAPFWSFLIALRAVIWLLKRYELKFTLTQGLELVAWLAAYAAAWRFDILKMYDLYAALPPQPPPDCYIATAAAQGHPRFVGSWSVQRRSGEMMRVNRQLQFLKCAELAWMAVQPRSHRRLRRVYDVVGRLLARQIRNPFLADLAYLLLKPLDLSARWILRRIVPEVDLIAQSMYTR